MSYTVHITSEVLMQPRPDLAPVKVGLVVSCQAPLGTSLAEYAESEIRLVHAARDGGWNSVWAVHHYMPELMQMPQPAAWLSRLITETGDMELGAGILVLPLLNPVDVAETYGSIDVLSGGRLILGVGLGYRRAEFEAFGLDIADRVRRLTTNVDILTRLWESPAGGVTAAADWVRLHNATLAAVPRRPRPTILVGANKEVAIRRAARIADGWLISPFTPRHKLEPQLDLFWQEREAAGRSDGMLVLGREIYCAPTDEEAVDVAARYLRDKYSAYASWRGSAKDGHRNDFAGFAQDRFVLGRPETCVAALAPYVKAGVRHFKFRTRWLGMGEAAALASIRLLTAEVVPALRELAVSSA
jgi:alkanesulfonate monooxygenase SsuD/methylene tetrahydromethanopterin reductase-like flavin-dependent oxidoreductase (luciferase family)